MHLSTLLQFSVVWHFVFQLLTSEDERKCVKVLLQHYFVKLPAACARETHQLLGWGGEEDWAICADWWCGPGRLQPGSASGSQAQESWHKNRLKAALTSLYMPVDALVERLKLFSAARYTKLCHQTGKLPDVPTEPFPDKYLLDGVGLAKQQRTGPKEYYAQGAYASFRDPSDGTLYVAFRGSFWYWDTQEEDYRQIEEERRQVSMSTLHLLVRMHKADNPDALLTCLRELGAPLAGDVPSRQELLQVQRVLRRHTLVIVGAEAERRWRMEPGPGQTGTMHTHGICTNCHAFCVWGVCEHLYAAFLTMGADGIKLTVPDRPQRQPATAPSTARAAAVLSDQRPRTRRLPTASETTQRGGSDRLDPQLAKLLEDHGLHEYSDAFRKHKFTLAELRHWSIQDLVDLLGCPAVPLRRLLTQAQHAQGSRARSSASEPPVQEANSFPSPTRSTSVSRLQYLFPHPTKPMLVSSVSFSL